MRRFHVEFDVDVPEKTTIEAFSEWARFHCYDSGECSDENPLIDEDFSPVWGTFDVWDRKKRI
jgi:hypothetical protein